MSSNQQRTRTSEHKEHKTDRSWKTLEPQNRKRETSTGDSNRRQVIPHPPPATGTKRPDPLRHPPQPSSRPSASPHLKGQKRAVMEPWMHASSTSSLPSRHVGFALQKTKAGRQRPSPHWKVDEGHEAAQRRKKGGKKRGGDFEANKELEIGRW